MCIKIIGTEEIEFNPKEPLENQILDAKEIIVSYDPIDPKIPSFVGQIEMMVEKGIGCKANIVFNANNYLNGLKLERKLEKLKLKLDVNEVVKGIIKSHAYTDKKLQEMSEMCIGKTNEQ